jgi:hypothetical protein
MSMVVQAEALCSLMVTPVFSHIGPRKCSIHMRSKGRVVMHGCESFGCWMDPGK